MSMGTAPSACSTLDCIDDGVRTFMPFKSSSRRTGRLLVMITGSSLDQSARTLTSLYSSLRYLGKMPHMRSVASTPLAPKSGNSVSVVRGNTEEV